MLSHRVAREIRPRPETPAETARYVPRPRAAFGSAVAGWIVQRRRSEIMKSIVLWLLGVPISAIVLLNIFDVI